MSAELYYQSRMSQGTNRLIGYIEARGAKEGALVTVRGYEGLWRVDTVHRPPQNLTYLAAQLARVHRGFPSLVKP